MAATVTETDDEIVAAVRLYLLDPSGTTSSLRLCREQGDRLAFNGASMTESDVDQIFVYTSTLSSPAPDYRVEFVLGNETFSLTAQTPPAFEITLPVEGDSVSRSAAVDVTWAPANPGSALRLELLADDPTCVTSAILEPEDPAPSPSRQTPSPPPTPTPPMPPAWPPCGSSGARTGRCRRSSPRGATSRPSSRDGAWWPPSPEALRCTPGVPRSSARADHNPARPPAVWGLPHAGAPGSNRGRGCQPRAFATVPA